MKGVAALLVLFAAALATAQTGMTFQLVGPTEPSERITGMYCTSVTTCVVSTEHIGAPSHIYLTDGHSITAALVTADSALSEVLGVLGYVGFMGFTPVGETLMVMVDGSGNALLTATGDMTDPASWTAATIGIADGSTSFGGGQQIGWGVADGRWVYFQRSTIYASTDPPSPGALWLPEWSPTPPGEVPSDLAELLRAEPNLCLAQPSVGISPRLVQAGYVAPDLSIVLYPAGARNQTGTVGPGVCVSDDGAQTFTHVPFPELTGDLGPLGVYCSGLDVCVAYGGLQSEPESVYIYITHDPEAGAAATWTRAQLPSMREDSRFRGVSFAPGGVHGWAVGAVGGSSPLLLATSDGGATWVDVTSAVRALAPDTRLHSVYAVDAEHVLLGGEDGVLIAGGF
ncbi:MAG TPA: hypothetical protein VFN03_04950 [Trueperaceae bacterium]|nr:hypothetical protein [Trueperaceae bacterium]